MAIKASIAMLLLRILVDATHRIILWATLVITEIYSAFFFLLFIFQCWPITHFWEGSAGQSGHCIDSTVTVGATYGYSAIICIGDWVFSLLPCIVVWHLQLRTRERILVGITLAISAMFVPYTRLFIQTQPLSR